MMPVIDLERCTGCGNCIDLCPAGALDLVDDKVVLVRPDDCIYCTECEAYCPSEAIGCPMEIVLAEEEERG